MIARVSVYEIPADQARAAVERFGEAIEEIRGLDGIEEAYFLVDAENGRAMTMTVWDGHQSAAASRVTATRLRGEAARAVDGSVISSEEFEVAVHVRAAAADAFTPGL